MWNKEHRFILNVLYMIIHFTILNICCYCHCTLLVCNLYITILQSKLNVDVESRYTILNYFMVSKVQVYHKQKNRFAKMNVHLFPLPFVPGSSHSTLPLCCCLVDSDARIRLILHPLR